MPGNNSGLEKSTPSSAYARGATGKGIVIGITDSGLDTSHDEISYSRVLPESNLTYSNYDPTTSQQRHGTMVASVAAGTLSQSNSSSMHGVAFDSEILFTAIQLAEPDDNYDPVDLGDTDTSPGEVNEDFTGIDNFFSSLFEIYNVAEVDIVNNSYGYSGNVIDYTESQIRSSFPKTIEEMAQTSTPDSEKQFMFGLQATQARMQMMEWIFLALNYYRACPYTFRKYKIIQLLWFQ